MISVSDMIAKASEMLFNNMDTAERKENEEKLQYLSEKILLLPRSQIPDAISQFQKAAITRCSSCNVGNKLTKNSQGEFEQRLKKCAKCLGVSYCSKECQVRDWAVHKTVCKKK